MVPFLSHLSHATIITGNRQKNLELLREFLTEKGIEIQGNPDICIFNAEQFLMDDARTVVAMLGTKKILASRYCIISTDRIASEVQNALLKTLEEPELGTHIILIVPDAGQLLATIRSRCQVVVGDPAENTTRLSVDEFLKKNLVDRFAYNESLTKNKDDADNVSKSEMVSFIDALERTLWDAGNRDESLYADIRAMREAVQLRGASHRMILDFIAMICG